MFMRVTRGPGISGTVVTVFVGGEPVFHYHEPVIVPEQDPGTAELTRRLTWDGGIRTVFNAGVEVGRMLENPNNTS